MERCYFCQAPIPSGATTCPTCDQWQPTTDYIPPERNQNNASVLTGDAADLGEQNLLASTEARQTEAQVSQGITNHEFPAARTSHPHWHAIGHLKEPRP